MPFAVSALECHKSKLEGRPEMREAQFLLESGRAACSALDIMSDAGRLLTDEQHRSLMSAYLHHVTMFKRAGGQTIPKHHMALHMIKQAAWMGNPKYFQTYHDETLNGVIAKIARGTHRISFAQATHRKFDLMQQVSAQP